MDRGALRRGQTAIKAASEQVDIVAEYLIYCQEYERRDDQDDDVGRGQPFDTSKNSLSDARKNLFDELCC